MVLKVFRFKHCASRFMIVFTLWLMVFLMRITSFIYLQPHMLFMAVSYWDMVMMNFF